MKRFLLPIAAAAVLAASWSPSAPGGPDAAAFGRLPTLHGGRIKPFDTVARSSLLLLGGRQSLKVEGKRLGATPWLLDVLARPEVADAYPVFRIEDPEVLGLLGRRREDGADFAYWQLEARLAELSTLAARAEAAEEAERTRFDRAILNLSGRIALYQRLRSLVLADPSSDARREVAEFSRLLPVEKSALAVLAPFFARWRFLDEGAAARPLPPASGEKPENWLSYGGSLLNSLRSGTVDPAASALAAMASAWRAADTRAFNAALAAYEMEIHRRAPRARSRALWEDRFNRLQPFQWGLALYLAAFLLAAVSWLPAGAGWARPAPWLYGAALLFHSSGLAWRMILEGRPPVTNLYSSAVFVGWTAAVIAFVLESRERRFFSLAAGAATGFGTLVIAHNLAAQGDTMEMMRAVLDSNFWLATHVVTITIGYGGAFLASMFAHMGLIRGWSRGWTRDKDLSSLAGPGVSGPAVPPPSSTGSGLAGTAYGVTCFSLFFSFLGTVLGGIWADQSWGRFWGWDPKENGALLIVLWQALTLHARWGGFIRERGLLVMTVGGGIVTALAWFGVNMLGVGLHSYGFMDSAFLALTAFIALEAAAAWFLARPGPPEAAA